jgi:3-hydroxyisobutyrate dehydrogenase-like beta-hydroxyacid dehydrogenase
MKLAVFGLGEAGGRYAADLAAAGHEVVGFDPGPVGTPAGVARAASAIDTVGAVELVVVLTPASLSVRLASECLSALGDNAVWADFTSASPRVMAEIGQLAASVGKLFADVAVLGPVPLSGAGTDLIVSGTGAGVVARLFGGIGASVEVLDSPAGDATSRKLLRSIVMKGMAAITVEAVNAARAAGCEAWMREQLRSQIAGGDVMIDRFLSGTLKHAGRRAHEMEAVVGYLTELGVSFEMSGASAQALTRIAQETRA